MTYEEAVANHRWNVPAHYNIARDVCDKHPPDKLAMVWEDYRGNEREVRWGELQELSNRFANVLRGRGVERGDRVAVVLPPTPETAAVFFGAWKVGAILLSMSVLYGDEGIAHRLRDSQARLLVTDAANRDRFEDAQVGELFHGMGEWAWAAGIAPLLGPWRLGATQFVFQRKGGFDPEQQLSVLSKRGVTNVFTTPTAMRAMMAIEGAGTRFPQQFRIVCSAGEPLNPEAIRWFREQYGITVLDYYGLTESYPLCANFPFMEVREGSMGKP